MKHPRHKERVVAFALADILGNKDLVFPGHPASDKALLQAAEEVERRLNNEMLTVCELELLVSLLRSGGYIPQACEDDTLWGGLLDWLRRV